MYISEVLAIHIIMQTTLSKPKTIELRSDSWFDQINLLLKKEQSVVIPLLEAFFTEKKATAQNLKR